MKVILFYLCIFILIIECKSRASYVAIVSGQAFFNYNGYYGYICDDCIKPGDYGYDKFGIKKIIQLLLFKKRILTIPYLKKKLYIYI